MSFEVLPQQINHGVVDMFRITLIAIALFATIANAATIRFDWVDGPKDTGNPPVTGYIDIQVRGPSIPAIAYPRVDDIVGYEINHGGHTITHTDPQSFVSAKPVSAGSFIITKGKLLLKGEVGSEIKFRKRMDSRQEPYARSLTVMKEGVYRKKDENGKTIPTADRYHVRYSVHLGDRKVAEYEQSKTVKNSLPPLGYHGVLVGTNARVIDDPVVPVPVPEPVDPVVPDPVVPVNPDDTNVQQLRARRSALIRELWQVQQAIQSLGG